MYAGTTQQRATVEEMDMAVWQYLVEDGERAAGLAALGEARDEVAVGDGVRLGPRLGLTHQPQHRLRLWHKKTTVFG